MTGSEGSRRPVGSPLSQSFSALDSLELYRLARDALTVAARRRGTAVLAEQPYWSLGSLRQVVAALDGALGAVGDALVDGTRTGELTTVEGLFVDDPLAGAVTARDWLERARAGLAIGTSEPLETAHIAIAGVAMSEVDAAVPERRVRRITDSVRTPDSRPGTAAP